MGTSDLNDIADIQHKLGKELARMRVLLVDRHASARNSMRIILSSLGITAVHNAGTIVQRRHRRECMPELVRPQHRIWPPPAKVCT